MNSKRHEPLEVKFWRGTVKGKGCWEWIRAKSSGGYGHLWYLGKLKRAHRASWEIHHGEISDDLEVCHKCDNPGCVNPDHLFLGTHKDNMQDALCKGKYKIKLSPDDVRFIRQHYVRRHAPELAKLFGVSSPSINNVVRGKTRGTVVSWPQSTPK